tara:strand:- start:295 stop:1023 length:729 start_codon:yes stop_codon:yes gene_type:complete
MNVFILAGGKGTRFREETVLKPKPMIEIKNIPMLIHIINHYMFYGLRDFTILGGFKQDYIVSYFKKNFKYVGKNHFDYRGAKILVLDTGVETMTGGRIKIAIEKLKIKDFMLTYGDGISNVNISKLEKFYNDNTFTGVVTAVRPPARFGRLKLSEGSVLQFGEKNQADEGWINGGFFCLSSKIINYIENEHTVFEKEPLEKLSKEGNLGAYIHNGFWQPVDTVREKEILEEKLNKDNLEWLQ